MKPVRADPFDIPVVRPELVEACGEFRRTRNGWDAQDVLLKPVLRKREFFSIPGGQPRVVAPLEHAE